jgi:hypothetical protein
VIAVIVGGVGLTAAEVEVGSGTASMADNAAVDKATVIVVSDATAVVAQGIVADSSTGALRRAFRIATTTNPMACGTVSHPSHRAHPHLHCQSGRKFQRSSSTSTGTRRLSTRRRRWVSSRTSSMGTHFSTAVLQRRRTGSHNSHNTSSLLVTWRSRRDSISSSMRACRRERT